jgi:hypothetical protein
MAMAAMMVEIPDEVLASAGDLPWLGLSRWDGTGLPASLLLRWIESQPFADWSAAALATMDPAELDKRDLPVYLAAQERAESFFAARKVAGINELSRRPKDDADRQLVDPVPHEVGLALRMPLGAAQTEVHYARRLATHLPGTRALFGDGQITNRHVRRIVAATCGLDQQQCALLEEKVLADAASLSATEFGCRVRTAVARINPRAHRDRHREAATQSDVTLEPSEDDAMAWLTARMPLLER